MGFHMSFLRNNFTLHLISFKNISLTFQIEREFLKQTFCVGAKIDEIL